MKRMLVLYFIGISVRRCIIEDRHFVGYEFYDEQEKPPEPEPETLRLQRRAVEILEREAKSGEDWKGDE